MQRSTISRNKLLALVLPLILAVTASGCTLLGLGAAAGAAVGGCSLLDQNEDDTVSEAELSAGLFDAWDDDGDDALTEAEFDAGVEGGNTFDDWSGDFSTWDADDDDELSQEEFDAGVAEGDATAWADSQCDDLGL